MVNYEKDLEDRCEQLEEVIKKQQEQLEAARKHIDKKIIYFITLYSTFPRFNNNGDAFVPEYFRDCEDYSNHIRHFTNSFDMALCFIMKIKGNTQVGKIIHPPSESLWKIIANYSNYDRKNSSNAFEFSGRILISTDLKNIKVYLQNPIAEKTRIGMIEERMREVFSMSDYEIDELIKSLDRPLF